MDPPPYTRQAQDFDTASIRSAAPSYVSNAPTYVSKTESPFASRTRSGLPSPYASPSGSARNPRTSSTPSLDTFRVSTLVHPTTSPNARHYHSVAQRRAHSVTIQEQASLLSAAVAGEDGIAQMKRRMEEEERERIIRTLEDPHLVGEVAAEEARQERLRRENGWNVLEAEDKRWDWLLAQMSDWEERDKSWRKFREEVQGGKRHKIAKRWGVFKGRD